MIIKARLRHDHPRASVRICGFWFIKTADTEIDVSQEVFDKLSARGIILSAEEKRRGQKEVTNA